MKQILQDLKNGEIILEEVPVPSSGSNQLLIKTRISLISAGTERMLLDFGRAGWISKARQQPEKVRQVLDKIRTDGLIPTIEAVKDKLDQPLPLGYCNVGVVLELGKGVEGFKRGDRVVSNGYHAEVVSVSKNLCAKIPSEVSDDEAVFTVIGATALQGIRLLEPTLGECFVVTGLGLVGQMAVQILLAHGCRVLGIDVNENRCRLANMSGAETFYLKPGSDPIDKAMNFSRDRGVDGVLITAATKSSEPISQAASMCRKKGRIVLTGVTGLQLNRSDFYEKELTFRVSCSYGPGRYDVEYEEKGRDYPLPYVRWTEQRNFEAVLDLMAAKKLDVISLISHRYSIDDAPQAYQILAENKEPYMGIILEYPERIDVTGQILSEKSTGIPIETIREERIVSLQCPEDTQHRATKTPVVGFIGAGAFTSRVLGPAVSKTNAYLKVVASASGISSSNLGRKLGFEISTTDNKVVFNDPEVDTVFITTRHDSHGSLVLAALEAGKHVFVEKPLCLTKEELESIRRVVKCSSAENKAILMVGFNRRFSPHVKKIRSLLQTTGNPKSFIMTVNAGAVPADHWVQDPEVGGGRIIGEVCHFVDLLRYLANSSIEDYSAWPMQCECYDTLTVQLVFEDGSIGSIHYLSNGNRSFPKERLEIFVQGRILQLDNFRKLRGYGWPGFKKMNLWRQDKGHVAEVAEFINAIRNNLPSPIALEEIDEVTRVCLELDHRVRS